MSATKHIAETDLHGRALPGRRLYRCGGCQHERHVLGVAVSPDFCAHCGAPWVSVSETVSCQRVSRVPES
jgi:hypothetical protein